MHRTGKQPNFKPPSSNKNAAGYAKRKSLKGKSKALGSADDVYEYEPERVRRAKVKLQLGKDEALGAGPNTGVGGSESEDEAEGSGGRKLHPRLVGEDNEDVLGEDEDEEIDSDQAFDESDEERFAGFDFPSTKVSLLFNSSQYRRGSAAERQEQSSPELTNVYLGES